MSEIRQRNTEKEPSKPEQKYEVQETPHKETLSETLHHFIGTLQQAPEFLKDELNYIRHGYRVNFKQKRQVIKSLFMWHNELINVWSHLAAAIFIFIMIGVIYSNYSQVWKDRSFNEFNDKLKTFYDDVYQFEKKINLKIEEGLHSLEVIKNEISLSLQNKIHGLTEEIGVISDFTKNEIEYLHEILMSQYNEKQLLISDAFKEFEQQFFQVIESKQLDWLQTYKKISGSQNIQEISRWPIFGFLVSAILCLGGSAIYHLFYCMSSNVNRILLRVDYAGICFLTAGSTFAPLFYGFYCDQKYAIAYTVLNGVGCTVVFIVSMFDFIHTLEWRPVKGRMYASLGFFCAVGTIHLVLGGKELLQGFEFTSLIPCYLLMGFFYIMGLVVYQVRCPEKQSPGTFDNCGHSHQIWHFCVVIAVFITYIPTINAYHQRLDCPCTI